MPYRRPLPMQWENADSKTPVCTPWSFHYHPDRLPMTTSRNNPTDINLGHTLRYNLSRPRSPRTYRGLPCWLPVPGTSRNQLVDLDTCFECGHSIAAVCSSSRLPSHWLQGML